MQGLQPGLVHSSRLSSAETEPITAPFFSIDDFLPASEAEALRGGIESHFADPARHDPTRHQVWNYWYVPDLYTYLRTSPEKVIDHALIARFHEALSVYAREVLGLGHVTWPNLSLYVDGCEQHLHNDSANGRLGYVYSLTRDARKTIGGETIVLREGDLFRRNMEQAAAGWGLYDLIPPSFNRLAMFDDRMPHGVRRVEGSMDPLEGRVVLHGHISEAGPLARGAIEAASVAAAIDTALADLMAELRSGTVRHHGPLTLRLTIAGSGRIERLRMMLNRIARDDGSPATEAVERILSIVRRVAWPPAGSATEAIVPLVVGGPLPWMRSRSGI